MLSYDPKVGIKNLLHGSQTTKFFHSWWKSLPANPFWYELPVSILNSIDFFGSLSGCQVPESNRI